MDIHRRTGGAERPDHVGLRIDKFEGEALVRIACGTRRILPCIGDLQRIDAGDEVAVGRIEEQTDLAVTQQYPGLLARAVRDLGNRIDGVLPEQRRPAGGEALQRRIVDLAGGGGHEAYIEIRDHEHRYCGNRAGGLGLPDALRILIGATGIVDRRSVGRGVGPGFLEPDDADGTGSCRITIHPVPELAIDQDRGLRIVQRHLAAGGQLELLFEVGDAIDIECRAGHTGGNVHHQVTAVLQSAGAHHATFVRADQPRVGLARPRIDHGEGCLLAGVRITEAHLETAVDGEQLNLVRDIGEEEHSRLAGGDPGQIGIQPAADAQVVGSEVEFADDQYLSVGADAQDDLAVEDLLRRVNRE